MSPTLAQCRARAEYNTYGGKCGQAWTERRRKDKASQSIRKQMSGVSARLFRSGVSSPQSVCYYAQRDRNGEVAEKIQHLPSAARPEILRRRQTQFAGRKFHGRRNASGARAPRNAQSRPSFGIRLARSAGGSERNRRRLLDRA